MEFCAEAHRHLVGNGQQAHHIDQFVHAFAQTQFLRVQDDRIDRLHVDDVGRAPVDAQGGVDVGLAAVQIQFQRLFQRQTLAHGQFVDGRHVDLAGDGGGTELAGLEHPVTQAFIAQVDAGFDALQDHIQREAAVGLQPGGRGGEIRFLGDAAFFLVDLDAQKIDIGIVGLPAGGAGLRGKGNQGSGQNGQRFFHLYISLGAHGMICLQAP